MKNIYIVAVFVYCMSFLSAQNLSNGLLPSHIKVFNSLEETLVADRNRSFSEKLDSITLSYGPKIVFYYNDDLEVTRMSTIVPDASGFFVLNRDYTFDQFGNINCLIESGDAENRKTLYYYSDDGNYIVSKMVYELNDSQWVLDEKVEYFQSEDETYGYAIKSGIDANGDWKNDEKVEYYFENGNIMAEYKSSWHVGSNEWFTSVKCEHTYDIDGNHLSATEFYKFGNDADGYQWIPDEQDVYEYDNNGNCIAAREFEYDPDLEIWEINNTLSLSYNLSQEWKNIAGFGIYEMDQPFNMRNKLLYMSVSTENMAFSGTYHYSSVTGVKEHQGREVRIWPNPCGQILNIQSDGVQSASIYSTDGRLVRALGAGEQSVDISNIARGYYMLKVSFKDGGVAVGKFLKQ